MSVVIVLHIAPLHQLLMCFIYNHCVVEQVVVPYVAIEVTCFDRISSSLIWLGSFALNIRTTSRKRVLFSFTIFQCWLQLNVKDSSNAKYVESSISFNEMKTFICMNAADHEKFYSKVREENGLIINAAVTLSSNPNEFQPSAPINRYRCAVIYIQAGNLTVELTNQLVIAGN